MPDGPGYRLALRLSAPRLADDRRRGRARARSGAPADLVLIDEVAPANLASWYLRHFTCDASAVCDPAADEALLAARLAPARPTARPSSPMPTGYLPALVPFIPLTAPVRWSLVAPRLTGFRPNAFARHPAVVLIAERQ